MWVFCEQRDGVILGTGYQLLSEGRKLADDLGVELCGVLLGSVLSTSMVEVVLRNALYFSTSTSRWVQSAVRPVCEVRQEAGGSDWRGRGGGRGPRHQLQPHPVIP